METNRTIKWQIRLLPVMIWMLAALTVFFFCASIVQLFYLHSRIERGPELDLGSAWQERGDSAMVTSVNGRLELARWKTLALLEGNALARRWHHGNVALMSRVWTKYLGFVTGMILALVGAAFVLGKLREPETTVTAETAGAGKLSIASTSPGLILTVLGTALMTTTIVTHQPIKVPDTALYIPFWSARSPVAGATAQLPPPPPLPQRGRADSLKYPEPASAIGDP